MLNFFRRWRQRKRQRRRQKELAETIVSELLSYIDTTQNFDGWANRYRSLFRFDPKVYRTLHEGLVELRHLLKEES